MKFAALRVFCLAALFVGIAWNIVYAMADWSARRNQPEATRTAMRWMPQNAAYAAQLGDEIYAGSPGEAKTLLEHAVRLNPYDAPSWIQLALLYESENDLPRAEAALVRSGAVDATYLPSWSLANYYFRHNQPDHFWYWAARAAHIAPGDATALFRLAWYTSPNAREIQSRLQLQAPEIRQQFVNFLITQRDPEAVQQAASQVDNTQTLLTACDWLISQNRPDLALTLWNPVTSRIGYARTTVSSPVSNGSFSKSPLSRCFDWNSTTTGGVSSFLNAAPNALGFEFSGDQPDSLTLLSQIAPVDRNKPYLLEVDYTTAGIAPGSGLFWEVREEGTSTILARTDSLSANQNGLSQACFRSPSANPFVHLSLIYRRQPGTVRIEGKLALTQVRLKQDTCPPQKN